MTLRSFCIKFDRKLFVITLSKREMVTNSRVTNLRVTRVLNPTIDLSLLLVQCVRFDFLRVFCPHFEENNKRISSNVFTRHVVLNNNFEEYTATNPNMLTKFTFCNELTSYELTSYESSESNDRSEAPFSLVCSLRFLESALSSPRRTEQTNFTTCIYETCCIK